MHISLQKSQMPSRLIDFVERHRIGAVCSIIIVLCLTYILHNSMAPVSVISSGNVRFLSLLDDPFYAHEYDRRAAYILKHLEMLKDQTHADRVYAVSYSYDLARFGTMVKISKTFEIGQIGVLHPVSHYQDFSRMGWLYFQQYQTMISGLYPPDEFPQGYGTELYDHDGNAVGYLGIDYRQGFPVSQVNEMELLQQTATAIKMSLLQPLE